MDKFFLSSTALSLAASLASVPAQAGRASGSFQVSIKIVAPPPAPKVTREAVSAVSPGNPPHPAVKRQVAIQDNAGTRFIVLKTEY